MSKRKLRGGMRACDEMEVVVALVANAYRLHVQFMDEGDLDVLCATLAPWLLPLLTHSHNGAHLALVLGDPMLRTIYLSRRVLRLLSMRSRHPVALTPLTAETITTLTSANSSVVTGAMGPVARLAVYQADALIAVAARMASDLASDLASDPFDRSGGGYYHIVTMPHAVAEAAALVSSGLPCRVLAIPRKHDAAAVMTSASAMAVSDQPLPLPLRTMFTRTGTSDADSIT